MTPTEQKAPPQGLVIDDLSKIRKAGTPLLSPDDRFLAYHVAVADYDADEQYDLIMLTPADQTAPVTIARGIAHGWSPDGRELLYETANGELHIYTVSTAASRFASVTRYVSSP